MTGKYTHPNWGDQKCYHLSTGWAGGFTVTEYHNGVKVTSLHLTDKSYNQFIEKLKLGGWHLAESERANRYDS